MTKFHTASCLQDNPQVKVNQNLISLIFQLLNYCDEQDSNGDQTAGEGPTDSLIQQSSQLKVNKTQQFLF